MDNIGLVAFGAAFVIAIGVLVYYFFKKGKIAAGICAALAYLVAAGIVFYVDVILYGLTWAIPVYIVCFVICPIAVYYVVSRADRFSQEGRSREKKKQPGAVRPQAENNNPYSKSPRVSKKKSGYEPMPIKVEERAPTPYENADSKLRIENEEKKQRASVSADVKRRRHREGEFQRVGVDFAEKVLKEAKSAQVTEAIPVTVPLDVNKEEVKVEAPLSVGAGTPLREYRISQIEPSRKKRAPIPTADQTLEAMREAAAENGKDHNADEITEPLVKDDNRKEENIVTLHSENVENIAKSELTSKTEQSEKDEPVNEVQEVKEVTETTETQEVKEVAEVTETTEVKEAQDTQEAQEKKEVEEVKEVQEIQKVKETEESQEVEEVEEVEEVQDAEEEKSVLQDYQAYFDKATSVKAKGLNKVAAFLFANSAALEVDAELQKKALFEELTCYMKAGENDVAIEKIEALSVRSDLTSTEVTKLKALLMLMGNQKS